MEPQDCHAVKGGLFSTRFDYALVVDIPWWIQLCLWGAKGFILLGPVR